MKVGALRAVTPADGSAPAAAPTPREHVRQSLGMDVAEKAGDQRPTLVYFHWPHEDPVNGKTVDLLCKKVLNSEQVARWGRLYRCVQVDMSSSDPKLTSLLGAGDKPSFVVVDDNALVGARIPALPTASKMEKALEAALRRFVPAWKKLEEDLADQDKDMALAKKFLKADRPKDALPLLDRIRYGDVRVGDQFDAAHALAKELEARLAREK